MTYQCSSCNRDVEPYIWDLCKECFEKEFEQVFDYGCVQCGRSIGNEGERVELRTSSGVVEKWMCKPCLAWIRDDSTQVEQMRRANNRKTE